MSVRYGGEWKMQPRTNLPSTISGREHSGHALDRMQARGIHPTLGEDTISHAIEPQGVDAKIVHDSDYNSHTVITNEGGRVVTTHFGEPK